MPVGDIQMSCWVMSWRSWAETTPRYCRISRSAFLLGLARVLLGLYCRWRTQAMDDSSNSNYSSNYILPSKRFEICRQLLRSFTFRLYETGCVRRFESRLTTYKMLALNSSRLTFFCGRYGYSFWPIWSFRVADVVVADMVCGRYRCGRYGTDPSHAG